MALEEKSKTTQPPRSTTAQPAARKESLTRVGGGFAVGDDVKACYRGQTTQKFPGQIAKVNADNTYAVHFADGDVDLAVKAHHVSRQNKGASAAKPAVSERSEWHAYKTDGGSGMAPGNRQRGGGAHEASSSKGKATVQIPKSGFTGVTIYASGRVSAAIRIKSKLSMSQRKSCHDNISGGTTMRIPN